MSKYCSRVLLPATLGIWMCMVSLAALHASHVLACSQPDLTPPTILCPATQTLIMGPGCHASLPDYLQMAAFNDDCLPAPTAVQSPAPGTLMSGTGSWSILLTVTDGAGNTSNCSFMVQRVDTAGPQVVCPPTTFEYTTPLVCRIPVSWPPPTVIDHCGSYTLTCSGQSGDSLSMGFHWIFYHIIDGQGRTDTCLFAKIVKAYPLDSTITQSPTIDCEGNPVTMTTLPGMAAYHWSTGGTNQSMIASQSGWYWVDVTAPNHCSARDSFYLQTMPLPQPMVYRQGGQICTDPYVSYQWLRNGIAIAGAMDSCMTPTLSGNYAVSVVDSNGCTATSDEFLIVNTVDAATMDWNVHPNPAADFVMISFGQGLPDRSAFALYDLCGRPMRTWPLGTITRNVTLNLEGLTGGTYVLTLEAEGIREAKRLVVNHFSIH
jgi:hypothetical protein